MHVKQLEGGWSIDKEPQFSCCLQKSHEEGDDATAIVEARKQGDKGGLGAHGDDGSYSI